MNKKTILRYLLLASLIVALSFNCFSCTIKEDNIFVTWMDTDGTLIESKTVSSDYDPTTRTLPSDTELWHYTNWTVSQSGNVIVCTAKRVSNIHVVWQDYDGNTLHEMLVSKNEDIPSFPLPESDDRWLYERWEQNFDSDQTIFQAVRVPNISYFVGNVFQIVIKDEAGTPLGSGSGFVINDDGWFVTNNHVMKDGYSATAFFDIKNDKNGEQYTQLEIIGGIYKDDKKDIFIGKLKDYDSIREYYHSIQFTENYTVGENAYSVGYPNSSITMEINAGVILEEYSDINSKIDGIYYILANSYIAPGSSGGILMNEKFEVVGITTMGLYSDSGNNYYISGGSIPYSLFKPYLHQLDDSKLKKIFEIYKN